MTDKDIKNKISVEKQKCNTALYNKNIKMFREHIKRIKELDRMLYGSTKDEALAIEGD